MSTFSPAEPASGASRWVLRWCAGLPRGARVLDFAAGSGRNSIALHEAGARVTAADIDAAALSRLPAGIGRVATDLEAQPWPFAPGSFDAVVCCNFLHRPRLDELFGLVVPGGRIVYETFARGNARFGRPASPRFLLAPGELDAAARRNGFVTVAFESGYTAAPRPAMVQRLCAARPPFQAEQLAL